MDFPTALRLFDAGLQLRGRADKTRHAYRREMTHFWTDWCAIAVPEPIDVVTASSAQIGQYVISFDAHGSKRGDILRAAKSFYGWLHVEGYRPDNPTVTWQIPKPRESRRTAPNLDDDRLRRIFSAAFAHPDERRGWAILLLFAMGARIGEFSALRRADIDLERGIAFFAETKGNRSGEEVVLTRKAAIAAEHLLAFGHDPIVGVGAPMFRKWLQAASQSAGIDERIWPHLLRHAFSHRLAAGCEGNPETWRRGMRHASLSEWSRYNFVDREEVREAMERAV